MDETKNRDSPQMHAAKAADYKFCVDRHVTTECAFCELLLRLRSSKEGCLSGDTRDKSLLLDGRSGGD